MLKPFALFFVFIQDFKVVRDYIDVPVTFDVSSTNFANVTLETLCNIVLATGLTSCFWCGRLEMGLEIAIIPVTQVIITVQRFLHENTRKGGSQAKNELRWLYSFLFIYFMQKPLHDNNNLRNWNNSYHSDIQKTHKNVHPEIE